MSRDNPRASAGRIASQQMAADDPIFSNDISLHSAPDLHVHHPRMHSAQPFLVRDVPDSPARRFVQDVVPFMVERES
jgi:hypothetical protein